MDNNQWMSCPGMWLLALSHDIDMRETDKFVRSRQRKHRMHSRRRPKHF